MFAVPLKRIFHGKFINRIIDAIDPKRMTDQAANACKEHLHMDPVDLMDKTLEDFQLNNNAVPAEIIQLRYNHFQNKRRSK